MKLLDLAAYRPAFRRGPRRFIFITGVMRSGTTLLQRVIETAPDCNRLTPEFIGPRAAIYYAPQQTDQEIREAIQTKLLDHWRDLGKPRNLIVKDPLMMRFLGRFLDLYPDMKMLIALRDPRDTIHSVIRVRDRLRASGHATKGITPLSDDQIIDWVMANLRKIPAAAKRENVLVIRYEHLVEKDAALLGSISGFIDLPISYDLPDTSSRFNQSGAFYSPVYGKPISRDRVGGHADLPPALLNRINDQYEAVLRDLGYGAQVSGT